MSLKSTALAALLVPLGALALPAGELRIGLENEPDYLDPDRSRLFVGRIVFTALCDKLIDVNENLELIPELATEWTVAEDGLSIDMTLREGVVFHDGTEFDAEAVRANIERSQTLEESVRKSEIASISEVEVVGPHQVRLHLTNPDATLLAQLADRAGMMMSPAAFADGQDFNNNPVCSGPFKFASRVVQHRIELERFADYWNADEILLDRVSYSPIPDSTVRLNQLFAGELDIINQMSANDIDAVERTDGFHVGNVTSLGYQGITVNTGNGANAENPLGQDARVRQALSLAIDRAALNQVVFGGAFEPANQPFPPSSPFHSADFPVPERDLDRARALLEEAGVETPLRVDINVSTNPDLLTVMQVVQSMANEAGFDVRIVSKEFATLIADNAAGDFQASQQGWSGRIDPDGNLHQFVVTGAGFNDGHYSNAEVDRLLNEARVTSDHEARRALYDDAQAILQEELPLIYLYYLAWLYGVSDKVEGFTPYADGMIRLEGVDMAG
ncbi:MAG: ABC transporter substrate-binding protein [Paracoccus sp. (in: a-proteobacteria)]|nr:ABC transporter substrate-binding protein [Paracoccus sp. (in: a-proteobacteria)]